MRKKLPENSPRPQQPEAELDSLAELVGEFMEYWGFKRIHGRMWTLLFVASTPLDAGELIQRLAISKALASMTLKDLLAYQVVLPAGRSPRGTELFRANTDTMGVILNVLRQREQVLLSKITEAFEALEKSRDSRTDPRISPERLQELGSLISNARSILDGVLVLKGS